MFQHLKNICLAFCLSQFCVVNIVVLKSSNWSFCRMKQLGVFLLALDRMIVHCRSLQQFTVPIYTPGWKEALHKLSALPKNTIQCPWAGLKPEPLDPGMSALTAPPHTATRDWLHVMRSLFLKKKQFTVPIYTPGWKEALYKLSALPKNTIQCPWAGLKPEPLDPGMSALTAPPLTATRDWLHVMRSLFLKKKQHCQWSSS